MTEQVRALDNYTPLQLVENGQVWSNSVREQILQFTFQVTRTTDDRVSYLKDILFNLLFYLKNHIQNSSFPEREAAKGFLSVLYRIIGQTRDIVDGKGEYTLTYMMIHTWYNFYTELSFFALKCLVDLGDTQIHQYGSWKDIKYFCKYCKNQGENVEHPLIQYAIKLTNKKLSSDYIEFISGSNEISMTAKWTPREKSSFGWLYHSLATNYYREFLTTAYTDTQHSKAILKCKTEYRKLLSKLNKHIGTLQIKQCEKNWYSIDFNKVTSISISKQKKAFLNIKKNGDIRFPNNTDRNRCPEHFNTHIQKTVKGENVLCDEVLNALQTGDPWSLLESILENKRYKIMSDKLSKEIEI
jgi:hypothetical protein